MGAQLIQAGARRGVGPWLRLFSALALLTGVLALWVQVASGASGIRTTNNIGNVTIANNVFQMGNVFLNGEATGATASVLPSGTLFTWSTAGAGGTNCGSVLAGLDMRNESMMPGHYCVAPVTLNMNHPDSVKAWLRLRLVRRTPAGDAGTEALNSRLRFYMSEYAAGSSRTASAYQTADCTASGFRPAVPTGGLGSAATIADVVDSVQGSRTALTSLGTGGKTIGGDLALKAGTNALPTYDVSVSPPAENMTTDSGSGGAQRSAYNLIGNDEVKNPMRISDSNAPIGTRPNGTLPEGTLSPRSSRYFCVAIYLPSDTTITAGNLGGDNLGAAGTLTYHLVVNAQAAANNAFN